MKRKSFASHSNHLLSIIPAHGSQGIIEHEPAPSFFDEEQHQWLAGLLRKAKPMATGAEIARFVEAVGASVAQWRLAAAMRPAAPARQVHNAMRQL